MLKPRIAVFILASFALAMVAEAADGDESNGTAQSFQAFSYQVPLLANAAGSFSVTGTLGGVEGEFLLDTGASMITVSRDFLESMTDAKRAPARRVAARLASGRVEAVEVYRFDTLQLGDSCLLGPVEVAVMPSGGRNLLGMNALMNAAPFAVSVSPPSLALSRCGLQPAVATR